MKTFLLFFFNFILALAWEANAIICLFQAIAKGVTSGYEKTKPTCGSNGQWGSGLNLYFSVVVIFLLEPMSA